VRKRERETDRRTETNGWRLARRAAPTDRLSLTRTRRARAATSRPLSFRTHAQSAVEAPDVQMQRQCVLVLQRLVESWADPQGGGAEGKVPGFDSYSLSHVAPALLKATIHPYLNLKDAGAVQLLEAVAAAQQGLHAALGARYSSFLLESALPSLGCSPELAATFVQHVASGSAGQRPVAFRDFLRSFAENYHASQQQHRGSGSR
jgi:hypothetical protein